VSGSTGCASAPNVDGVYTPPGAPLLCPGGRKQHAAVVDRHNCMWVFGGKGFESLDTVEYY
jgi:hypothetical protein